MKGGADATVGVPPGITHDTRPFWDGAALGRLVVERCCMCGLHVHPPRGVCRRCRRRDLEWVDVRDRGVVATFTVNHHPWWPGLEVPYVLALVEFPDRPGLEVLGRVRGLPADAVRVGMIVEVGFEPGPSGTPIPSFVAVPESA